MLNFMVMDDPIAAACRDILVLGFVAIAFVCLIGVLQFRALDQRRLANLAPRLWEPIKALKAKQMAHSRRNGGRQVDTRAHLHRISTNREMSLLLPELAED